MVENCRGRLEKPSAYRRYIERGEFLESEAAQLKSPQDKFGKRSTVDLGSSRHSLSNCEFPRFLRAENLQAIKIEEDIFILFELE